MKLATFDIFDTALVRKCGLPDIVPHLVAHRLWPDDEMARCEFLNARRQAASGKGAECTLADIYSADCLCTLPDYAADRIMGEELAVEADMLAANRRIAEKISLLRSEGWTVKFLSDMYLPSQWLKKVLLREGCAEEGDEVIVSCEWAARKDDGSLYRKVRGKYAPEQWLHFGDNRRSDYKMARRNGVKATLVVNGFTAVENRVCSEGTKMRGGWRMALLAGMSRASRLHYGDAPAHILAADYVAALYVPFVLWVLRSAERRGIKRLHFLSRDGYIMMKIAEALGTDVELNYLFVSRKALMRAYLTEDSAKRYLEIADGKTLIRKHTDVLLERLQLDRDGLKTKYGIGFAYDRIITEAQQEDFIDKLFAHPEFTPQLLASFAEDARLTESYLRQEGLADDVPQAMIDIGWLGTSRHMVNAILGKNIPTYYVGVRNDVYPRTSGDYDSYFECGQLSTEATGLIENYFSASPWPSTVGYSVGDEGGIMPGFASGQDFAESDATVANTDVCRKIAGDLKPWLPLLDDEMLFRWAGISLDGITQMRDRIDLTPIVENDDFDGTSMLRKLGIFELLDFALLGGRYTAFDRGSAELTVGHRCAPGIWRLHRLTAGMRGLAYRAYLKLKK